MRLRASTREGGRGELAVVLSRPAFSSWGSVWFEVRGKLLEKRLFSEVKRYSLYFANSKLSSCIQGCLRTKFLAVVTEVT